MGKPLGVWVGTIVIGVGALFYALQAFSFGASLLKNLNLTGILMALFYLANLVIGLVFLKNFFDLKRAQSLFWNNVLFGLVIFGGVAFILGIWIMTGRSLLMLLLFPLIAAAVIWFALRDYIANKKTAAGEPVFA